MDEELADLGCANDWEEPPEVVRKCAMLGHVKSRHCVSESHTDVWCEKCGYEFWMDSSD